MGRKFVALVNKMEGDAWSFVVDHACVYVCAMPLSRFYTRAFIGGVLMVCESR